LRYPLRSAEKHRRLLPGNRTRRTRWIAERLRAAVQRGRRDQADAVHRRKAERTGAKGRARAIAADGTLRRVVGVPARRAASLFRREMARAELRRVRQLFSAA